MSKKKAFYFLGFLFSFSVANASIKEGDFVKDISLCDQVNLAACGTDYHYYVEDKSSKRKLKVETIWKCSDPKKGPCMPLYAASPAACKALNAHYRAIPVKERYFANDRGEKDKIYTMYKCLN